MAEDPRSCQHRFSAVALMVARDLYLCSVSARHRRPVLPHRYDAQPFQTNLYSYVTIHDPLSCDVTIHTYTQAGDAGLPRSPQAVMLGYQGPPRR